jgi:phenylacetate-coenzyme A ligase PaaK-like adenylate-forming protein
VQVEGRSDDVVYFPSAGSSGGLRPFFPDTLRRAVLLADADIIDYRVLQEAAGSLKIHLAVASGAGFETTASRVRESVVHTLSSYGCHTEKLSIEQGLPDEPLSRKRRRVRRM